MGAKTGACALDHIDAQINQFAQKLVERLRYRLWYVGEICCAGERAVVIHGNLFSRLR